MKRKRKNDDKSRPVLRWILPVGLLTVAMGILLIATINEQAEALITPTPFPYEGRYFPRTPTPNPIAALPHDQCMYTQTVQIQPRETFAAYETLAVPSPDGRYAIVREVGGGLYLTGVDGTRQYIDSNYDVMLGFETRIAWSPNSQRVAIVASRVELDLRVILLDVNGRRHDMIDNFRNNNVPGYWSADGDYWLEAGYETVRVWRFTDDTPVYVVEEAIINFSWSPVGSTLAYVEWRVDDNHYALVMHDMNTGAQVEFELPTIANAYQFYWSPDGQRVALQSGDRWGDSQHIINFYGLDGSSELYVGYDTMQYLNGEWTAPLLAQWLPDSQHAVTYRQIEANHYQLVAYDVPTLNSRVLFDLASRPPSVAPDSRHAVVYQTQGDGEAIQVIDTLSGVGRAVIWNADDAGDAYWSHDGQVVAVVWALGEGAERRLFLSWMDVYTGEITTLDDGLWDVRHVYWLADSQHFVYEAVRGDGISLEMVNVGTGETTVLIDSIAETNYYAYNADSGTLRLWWQTTDGQSGRDVYAADGRRVNRWLWQNDLPDNLNEFPSPDGTVIAVKIGGNPYDLLADDESLTLIYPDGRPPVRLFTRLSGLSNPLWSPDSQLISFITADEDVRAPILRVYSAEGESVWSYPNLPQWIGGFMWMECD